MKKHHAKKSLPKGTGNIMAAIILTAISANSFFNEGPVARLFAYGEYALSVGFIVSFYWQEMKIIYEKKDQLKKKIISVLSALSVLIFAPLMIVLMSWLFYSLHKQGTRKAEIEMNTDVERNQKEMSQYYVLAVAVLIIGTFFAIYSNLKP